MRTEIVSRNMDDLIELNSLARALDAITELMEQPFDSYMDKPTPCPGWDVRALIDHIVDLTVRIGAAAGIVVSDQPDATPQQRIVATVRPIIEGWQRRGMSGTIIRMPTGTLVLTRRCPRGEAPTDASRSASSRSDRIRVARW